MHFRLSFKLSALTFLVACDSKPLEEMNYAERQALASEIVERCRAYGIPGGSPQMMQCTQAELESDIAKREGRRKTMLGVAQGMETMGNSMQQQAAIAQSRNVTCTSQRMGNTVSTNCN